MSWWPGRKETLSSALRVAPQLSRGVAARPPFQAIDVSRSGTVGSIAQTVAVPDQDAPLRVRDRAAQLISETTVTRFEDLPFAVGMYGSEKSDTHLDNTQKELMGALVHEDGTVTPLITPEGNRTAHLCKAFVLAISKNYQTRPAQIVAVAVLASAYAHYAVQGKGGTGAVVPRTVNNDKSRQFAFEIIEKAMETDTSDIHVEIRGSATEKSATIRFRIDGQLETVQTHSLPAEIGLVKTMGSSLFQGDYADERSRSNTQSSERVIQNVLIRIPELRNIALRYQTVTDKDGYDIIMRLLTYDGKSQELLSMEKMGFETDQVSWILEAISRPYGASFMGGSTGAGKTTTLAGAMYMDPLRKMRKRYSCEDPVEIDMEDVTQTPVQRAGGDDSVAPFLEVLKAYLRGDPDLIIVGEVREKATASIMVQLALTGHNVWATLHINRMFDALIRLTDESIGVEYSILGSNTLLNLLSSQTLVKTLCSCKIPAQEAVKRSMIPSKLLSEADEFGLPLQSLFVANRDSHINRNQCPICQGKGEKGRTVCAEMTLLDDELKDLIVQGQLGEVEKVYRKRRKTRLDQSGMDGKTMLDHALLKAARGQICIKRAAEVAGGGFAAEISSRKYRGYFNV
ncbi:MAG: GspE/PulE family protein [Nitrospiraceae bacterium]